MFLLKILLGEQHVNKRECDTRIKKKNRKKNTDVALSKQEYITFSDYNNNLILLGECKKKYFQTMALK